MGVFLQGISTLVIAAASLNDVLAKCTIFRSVFL
jgi:hypothetical protein